MTQKKAEVIGYCPRCENFREYDLFNYHGRDIFYKCRKCGGLRSFDENQGLRKKRQQARIALGLEGQINNNPGEKNSSMR